MMKKMLLVAFAFALLFAGGARAATIIYLRVTPDFADYGRLWTLTLETPVPVAAIGVNVPDGTLFTINPLNVHIAPFGAGSSFTPAATPGRLSLNLNPVTCVGINCTPFVTNGSTILGTWRTPTYTSYLDMQADDDSVGGTLFDSQLNVYPASCSAWGVYSPGLTCVVPEPELGALLVCLLAVVTIRSAVTARSASQVGSGTASWKS